MADSSEQLVSFFLYSLFVYPVTNYIITAHKNSSRWKGALYAIAFLLSVSVLHMVSVSFIVLYYRVSKDVL